MANQEKPQIRWRRINHNEVYAHNYHMAVIAPNKGEALKIIKENFPAEYDVIELINTKSENNSSEKS